LLKFVLDVAGARLPLNTLIGVSPAVPDGPQQLTLTNATGETVSLDAAVIAN
jgi:hypothetical protein